MPDFPVDDAPDLKCIDPPVAVSEKPASRVTEFTIPFVDPCATIDTAPATFVAEADAIVTEPDS